MNGSLNSNPLAFSFVISRYGAGILGGAENLARSVAERLAARGHRVRILTTCANDYKTWINVFPTGTALERGVEVCRFPVAHGRTRGDDILKLASSLFPGASALTSAWLRAQGPVVPDLLARLPAEAVERDLIVFFQLLSWPTVVGLPAVARSSVLVPLLHRERGARTALARRTLCTPRTLFANTAVEARAIAELAGDHVPAMDVVGAGGEIPTPPAASSVPLPRPYLVCMGRAGKTKPLARVWRELSTRTDLPPLEFSGGHVAWTDVTLVVVGERPEAINSLRHVHYTGYVDDAARWDILRGAVALVNPSLYESLSLVLLEAWTVALPTVVNLRCEVTADLAARSGGGLAIDFEAGDAAAAIAAGLRTEADRQTLGRNGHDFVAASFVWDRVLDQYERAAREAAAARR
jgi:glycosyltransferase involved in cell wall biosynthesis